MSVPCTGGRRVRRDPWGNRKDGCLCWSSWCRRKGRRWRCGRREPVRRRVSLPRWTVCRGRGRGSSQIEAPAFRMCWGTVFWCRPDRLPTGWVRLLRLWLRRWVWRAVWVDKPRGLSAMHFSSYCIVRLLVFVALKNSMCKYRKYFSKIGRCWAVFFAPQGYLWVLERALKTDSTVKKWYAALAQGCLLCRVLEKIIIFATFWKIDETVDPT